MRREADNNEVKCRSQNVVRVEAKTIKVNETGEENTQEEAGKSERKEVKKSHSEHKVNTRIDRKWAELGLAGTLKGLGAVI